MKKVSKTIAFLVLSVLCSCQSAEQGRIKRLNDYWNGYDFTSNDALADIKSAEKRFEDYAKLLNAVPEYAAVASVHQFMQNVEKNEVSLYVYMEWFEIYFNSLASPYRNIAVFDAYLDALIGSDTLDSYQKLRPATLKNILSKNRVGHAAEDFAMTDPDGREFRLSDMKGRRILLFLVDAECTSCREIMDEATHSHRIGAAARRGEMQLLAVAVASYREAVRSLATDYGELWTIASCTMDELTVGDKYDTSSIPSFILIGADGNVEIGYDTDISKVERSI